MASSWVYRFGGNFTETAAMDGSAMDGSAMDGAAKVVGETARERARSLAVVLSM
jgi:hypothetical protein